MRPPDLAPNATIVRSVLLDLGLVNVSHFLSTVPRHLLFGIHPLDLNQGRVRVLIGL